MPSSPTLENKSFEDMSRRNRMNLTECNARIATFDALIVALQAERCELIRDRNRMLPFGKMPLEILAYIFEEVTHALLSKDHFRTLLDLRLVCRDWMDAVDGSSQLWRVFPGKELLSYPYCDKVLARYVVRSRAAPMNIYIGGHDSVLLRYLAGREALLVKCLVDTPGLLERVHTLSVHMCSTESWENLVSPYTLHRLDHLESLTLTANHQNEFQMPDSVATDIVLPNLKEFYGRNLPMHSLNILGSQLTVLSLENVDYTGELFGVLQGLEGTLAKLILTFTTHTLKDKLQSRNFPHPVTLPHLESFSCTGGLRYWTSDLILPSLTALKFHTDYEDDDVNEEAMTTFFHHFQASLTTLVFHPVFLYAGYFTQHILRLKSLTDLSIELQCASMEELDTWELPAVIGELFEGLMGLNITRLSVVWDNHADQYHELQMYEHAWTRLIHLVGHHHTLDTFDGVFRAHSDSISFRVRDDLEKISRASLQQTLASGYKIKSRPLLLCDNVDSW